MSNPSFSLPLDHLVILVSDLKTSVSFYDTLLPAIGFTRQRDHVYVNAQGIALDIRLASQPDHPYQRFAPGLNHIGFTADSPQQIKVIQQQMRDVGFEIAEIQHFDDGQALFIKDPDGMRVEISTYTPGDVAGPATKPPD